ncbi:MAG: hypothetical protein P4L40_13835 [Terracidiphilus sp.]|nr:hypothetical protein [Terracidiphilus sp.]
MQYEEEVGVLQERVRELERAAKLTGSQRQLADTLHMELESVREEMEQVCVCVCVYVLRENVAPCHMC